jgi:hypothetical protein
MRRTQVIAVLALALLGTVLPTVSESATDTRATAPGRERVADEALHRADSVLDGVVGADHDATLALRDLARALPSLDAAERRRATALLARPTSRADRFGDAYRAPAKRACSRNICMHWVSRTSDAPRSRAWVTTTLNIMKQTWAHEVGSLGYRRPARDGGQGGDNRFDVYLKDVGADGLYGYCAPERTTAASKWVASGYCVLDDDFARSQFRAKPILSLKATAAHEFFHAIQFAYDYAEDAWFMEASATWMEEQVFDSVDDNRQYVPFGQVGEPRRPLDIFQSGGGAHYGNWVFFEYLSHRFGKAVVHTAWQHAAAVGAKRGLYSTRAVEDALPPGSTFPDVFRDYAASLSDPSRFPEFYPEGDRWAAAPPARRHVLTSAAPTAGSSLRIDHLASWSVRVVPGAGLGDPATRLEVTVDGPTPDTSRAANLVVLLESGAVQQQPITFGDPLTVGFDNQTVRWATITLANASTRFDCWQGTAYSCRGIAADNDMTFTYDVQALPG